MALIMNDVRITLPILPIEASISTRSKAVSNAALTAALINAINCGNKTEVARLIETGADLLHQDSQGLNALEYAFLAMLNEKGNGKEIFNVIAETLLKNPSKYKEILNNLQNLEYTKQVFLGAKEKQVKICAKNIEIQGYEIKALAVAALYWGLQLAAHMNPQLQQNETFRNAIDVSSLISVLSTLLTKEGCSSISALGTTLIYAYASKPFQLFIQTLWTSVSIKNTIQTLKSCWQNSKYNKGKALLKGAITVLNTADSLGRWGQSAHRLFMKSSFISNIYKNFVCQVGTNQECAQETRHYELYHAELEQENHCFRTPEENSKNPQCMRASAIADCVEKDKTLDACTNRVDVCGPNDEHQDDFPCVKFTKEEVCRQKGDASKQCQIQKDRLTIAERVHELNALIETCWWNLSDDLCASAKAQVKCLKDKSCDSIEQAEKYGELVRSLYLAEERAKRSPKCLFRDDKYKDRVKVGCFFDKKSKNCKDAEDSYIANVEECIEESDSPIAHSILRKLETCETFGDDSQLCRKLIEKVDQTRDKYGYGSRKSNKEEQAKNGKKSDKRHHSEKSKSQQSENLHRNFKSESPWVSIAEIDGTSSHFKTKKSEVAKLNKENLSYLDKLNPEPPNKHCDISMIMKRDACEPKSFEEASLVLNPKFDWKEFKEKGIHYIKKPYRRLALKAHPDKVVGGKETEDAIKNLAETRFRKIAAAYEQLEKWWKFYQSIKNKIRTKAPS